MTGDRPAPLEAQPTRVPTDAERRRSLRHDLRTPLNHILGYTDLLLEECEERGLPAPLTDLRRIRAAASALLALVVDLLDDEHRDRVGTSTDLSRDLRTHLGTIVGYADLLLDEAADSEREWMHPDLATIRAAGTHLLALAETAVRLPRNADEADPPPAPEPALNPGAEATWVPVASRPRAGVGHPGRLLVVDDNALNRDVLARRLRHRGYEVAEAASGPEALDRLRNEPFDLLLLDMVMPLMPGIQVLEHLKADAALRDLPILVLSAQDELDDAVACIERGADDYLPKPFNTVLLLARIEACLEKKRLRDREVAYLRQVAQVTGPAAIARLLHRQHETPHADPPAADGESALLADVRQLVTWLPVRKGEILTREGTPCEMAYVVVRGRMHLVSRDDRQHERVVGQLQAGDLLGAWELLGGGTWPATAVAARHSLVAALSRTALDQLTRAYPRVLTRADQDVVGKLLQSTRPVPPVAVTTFAIVPTHPSVPVSSFARRLADALREFGETLHLDATRVGAVLGADARDALTAGTAEADDSLAMRLSRVELQHRFVVYEADLASTPWSRLCLRQADQVLLVGLAGDEPESVAVPEDVAPRQLVLLHPEGASAPSGTSRWLAAIPVSAHHHVRLTPAGFAADVPRLARRLAGRGVGLVLSGGGMRAAAHIGVVRALREAGVSIDSVGGTSSGAIVAAQIAAGWPIDRMLEANHQLAVVEKVMRDYTLPLVSLLEGRRLTRGLQRMFGDTPIEDLWLPFFAVSSNLTRADVVVHHRGPVWRALRASSSLPGILPPVMDGDDLLVDGAVLDNLPVDVMERELGGSRVIAVDLRVKVEQSASYRYGDALSGVGLLANRLNPFARERWAAPGLLSTLMRSALLGSVYAGQAQLSSTTLYLNPPVARFPMLDGHLAKHLYHIGYETAASQVAEWRGQGLI